MLEAEAQLGDSWLCLMFATMQRGEKMIEDDVEELKKRVEQLEACCKELREKIRPERIVPDIYRFDDELVKRLGGRV